MPAEKLNPAGLWDQTVRTVKDRVNSRSLWETMEKASAISIEGDMLIIGLEPRLFNLAGHLNVSEHKNAIERSLTEIAGTPFVLRVIEGSTIDDWTALKKREAKVAASREASYVRRERLEGEANSWDAVYEYAAKLYSATPLRQLPQSKARYLTGMLYVLADAADKLLPENPDEPSERLLARVIDRVASNAEVPAPLVALELDRLRAWQKQTSAE